MTPKQTYGYSPADYKKFISCAWKMLLSFGLTYLFFYNGRQVVGGIAWVHSRIENGEVKVSPQSFFVNNALLSQYQTSAKRQEAIVSYKGNLSVPFLTPNVNTPAAPVAP